MEELERAGTQPVFVVGRHRSGTTWVTNILGAHPIVFTPEHKQHQGQHESAYFSNLLPYCRWGKTESDRLALAAIFQRSDYWRLLFPYNPPRLDIEELGVNGYFEEAMDEAAFNNDCSYWVENTPAHTMMIQYLLNAFPHAYFVAVIRNRKDTIRSNVYKFGSPEKVNSYIKAAIWTELYLKILFRYRENLIFVSYENLENCFDEEKSRLFSRLGLAAHEMVESCWKPDSSYDQNPPDMRLRYRGVISFIFILFKVVPARLAEKTVKVWIRVRRPQLPGWFFRVYRGEEGGRKNV